MSETNNTNNTDDTITGPYGVTLYVNTDGHLVFENNPDFKVTYTIDNNTSSETYGHLMVSYGATI